MMDELEKNEIWAVFNNLQSVCWEIYNLLEIKEDAFKNIKKELTNVYNLLEEKQLEWKLRE